MSPRHAMLGDGVLVEARDLLNGATVAIDVEYLHLELDVHDVILANGALSETFVDDNSRITMQVSGWK